MGTEQKNEILEAGAQSPQNILYLAVGFSGKQWNIKAGSIFEAADALKKNTKLDTNDPNYIDPADVFQIIDVPG